MSLPPMCSLSQLDSLSHKYWRPIMCQALFWGIEKSKINKNLCLHGGNILAGNKNINYPECQVTISVQESEAGIGERKCWQFEVDQFYRGGQKQHQWSDFSAKTWSSKGSRSLGYTGKQHKLQEKHQVQRP